MVDKKSIWNSAGRSGLILGAVCVAYLVITSVSGTLTSDSKLLALLISFLNTCLWLAKFIGCILLMKFLMKRFAASEVGADNSDTFKFGAATAFLSALIYSAAYLAWVLFIQPDTFQEAFDMMMQSSAIDSSTFSQLEEMMPKMPMLSFFGNLIYCWLFGTILSAIFSRNIPSRNPFDTNNPDEQ